MSSINNKRFGSKVKKLLKLIFINILVCIFIIASVEIIVRVGFTNVTSSVISKNLFRGERFGSSYGLRPNVIGHAYGAKVVTDGWGFRIDPYLPTTTNRQNILVLGDSIAFGAGVAADDSLPFILQKKLRDCKIINSSVIGYSATDYYNVLKGVIEAGLVFEGVIVGICLNDFVNESKALIIASLGKAYSTRYPNRFLRMLKYILGTPPPGGPMQSSQHFNLLGVLTNSRTYVLLKSLAVDTSKNYLLSELIVYNMPNIDSDISHDLTEINELAVNNGKWIVFIIFPYEYQLHQNTYSNPEFTKPQKLINEVAQKDKLPVIDLLPLFKKYLDISGKKSKSLYLFDDPMHFSIAGHQVAAQYIYEEITKRGLAE
jgi:hypothetical protein